VTSHETRLAFIYKDVWKSGKIGVGGLLTVTATLPHYKRAACLYGWWERCASEHTIKKKHKCVKGGKVNTAAGNTDNEKQFCIF